MSGRDSAGVRPCADPSRARRGASPPRPATTAVPARLCAVNKGAGAAVGPAVTQPPSRSLLISPRGGDWGGGGSLGGGHRPAGTGGLALGSSEGPGGVGKVPDGETSERDEKREANGEGREGKADRYDYILSPVGPRATLSTGFNISRRPR